MNHLEPKEIIDNLTPNYWLWLAFYLGLSAVCSPKFNSKNIGPFGGFMDNPFSLSDDWNRLMRFIAILLAPGKFVCYAGYCIFHFTHDLIQKGSANKRQ